MAQGKPSAPGGSRRSNQAGGTTNRPGTKATGPGRTARTPGSKSSTAAAAKRPPTKRKGKSIVNQKQTPWGLIATVGAVVVFAVVIVIAVVVNQSGGSKQAGSPGVGKQVIPTTPTGAATKEPAVKRIKNTTGISGVLAFDTGGTPVPASPTAPALQRNHVTGPVDYSVLPPVGGPHNATWMNAGVYTKPVPSERAVHNLEHGAVWITYDPDLSKSKVAALRAFVDKQSLIDESQGSGVAGQKSRYMDLSPWASNSLPTPIVMSSWGFQLRLTSPTDPRMQKFVDMFRNSSKYTPEYGSPVDGQPVSTSGRAAFYGATKPNPAN